MAEVVEAERALEPIGLQRRLNSRRSKLPGSSGVPTTEPKTRSSGRPEAAAELPSRERLPRRLEQRNRPARRHQAPAGDRRPRERDRDARHLRAPDERARDGGGEPVRPAGGGGAVTLRPREFAFWPDRIIPSSGCCCARTRTGKHWTLRGDPELVKMLRDMPAHLRADLEVGREWEKREGWPDEWVDER